ncbi:TonB-dependent receptor [Pseudoalteromonas sp.]|nr:TonB-dependent receptor [Pseudoalteromonas sp.]
MTLKQTFCLYLCLSAAPILAAESEDLFSMSFEDLLNVQVDIGSNTSETLASAPSTITVFNKQKINLLGVDSAYELMNFVPGMQSTRGDWVGAVPKDHARGVYLDSGNVLVMINGERINESSFGKASVYMPFIPIEIIEKVEFIRGPGSALYGSNAFMGVMNVVTKHDVNEVTAMIGSNGKRGVSLSAHYQFNEDVNAFTSLAINKKEGDYYPQGVRDPLKSIYFEAGVDINELQIRGRYNKVELDEFINLAGYSKQNQHQSENHFVSVAYDWLQNTTTQLTTKVAYSEHDIQSAGLILAASNNPFAENDFLNGPAWTTSDLKVNIDFKHQLTNDWVVNAGYEFSDAQQKSAGVRTNFYDQASGNIILDDAYYLGQISTIKEFAPFASLKASFETHSVYGQLKIPLSETVTVFLGSRFDDVKNIESKLSPRFATIYQPTPANTFKLQYGESFRTPVTNELYSNDDVTVGNPELRSEYVKTTELVWRHEAKSWHSNMVLFHNQLHDFISTIPQENKTNMFTFSNQLDDTNRGVEIDSRWNITPEVSLTGTYTQYFDEPIKPTFKRFASIISSYQLDQWLFSINGLWRGEVKGETLTTAPFVQSSYMLFSATSRYSINDKSHLTLKMYNLFDKQYNNYDPRVANGAVAGVSREISLNYSMDF